jgi:hypothetical protein
MEMENEETWLRKRIVRLRVALRYANDSRTEVVLREVIGDAENRLEDLQASRGRSIQQQQQLQPVALAHSAGSWRRALARGLRLRFGQ